MGDGEKLNRLFEYASGRDFDAFDRLLAELEDSPPAEGMGEAWLMRAQIRLFSADTAFSDDLERAGEAGGPPRFPCLGTRWLSDCPNRFVVFPPAPGALQGLLARLPQAAQALRRRYGQAGAAMAGQLQSEILYFSGRFNEALALADGLQGPEGVTGTEAILAQCVRYRCYLAAGLPQKAEAAMLEMIRISKTHPECLDAYQSIRRWANLTTGWSGDNPRFYSAPGGQAQPFLEDRLDAIREGYSLLSPLEEPFVRYAGRRYEDAYPMRVHYMDVFHTMYWFQAGDYRQAGLYFSRAYQTSAASGIIMPFAEYGRQIVPLLKHMESSAGCPPAWLNKAVFLAERYDESLEAYRLT